MNEIYLLLGSNLGDRLHLLSLAAQAINEQIGKIVLQSAVYETAAWGVENQAAFLNQVVLIHSPHSAHDILDMIHSIEKDLGRIRLTKWGERAIDIDILYYNTEILSYPDLIIPHPFIAQRRFTLVPLAEIAPNYVHPSHYKSNAELLALCTDMLNVKKLPL